MISYKSTNPGAFKNLESVGMKISTFKEISAKFNIGLQMGIGNFITVLFGLFAVKNVNIPM